MIPHSALQAQQRRREARKRVAQIKEDKNALSASMSWLEVSDFDPLVVAVKECTAQAQVLAPLETISACGQLDVKEELEKRFVEAQNAVTDAINLGADKIEIGNKNYIAKKAFEDIEAAKKQGHSAFWRCIANSYTSTLRPSPPEKSGSSGSPSTLQGRFQSAETFVNRRKDKLLTKAPQQLVQLLLLCTTRGRSSRFAHRCPLRSSYSSGIRRYTKMARKSKPRNRPKTLQMQSLSTKKGDPRETKVSAVVPRTRDGQITSNRKPLEHRGRHGNDDY